MAIPCTRMGYINFLEKKNEKKYFWRDFRICYFGKWMRPKQIKTNGEKNYGCIEWKRRRFCRA